MQQSNISNSNKFVSLFPKMELIAWGLSLDSRQGQMLSVEWNRWFLTLPLGRSVLTM